MTDEGIRAKMIGRLPDHKDEIEKMSFGAYSESVTSCCKFRCFLLANEHTQY